MLNCIWTGYPQFKLKDEQGIPKNKIATYPWLQAPYMFRGKVGLDRWKWLNREWAWLAHDTLDKHVASQIKKPTVVVALSASGELAGRAAQTIGGFHICDRGSTHILFQERVLREEYKRWGCEFPGIDPRIIKKELVEYENSDRITVPSEFVKQSFIQMGIPENKLSKVVYGARLDRFYKTGDPSHDLFRVLWVGGVSIRKGFMYALRAFQSIKHPNKEFLVVGHVSQEIRYLLKEERLENVRFAGQVPNSALPDIYSKSHVFIIPSIEEGLAMVQGEALACGCPVIATKNTGSEEIITDSKEGFIIPSQSSEAIAEKFQIILDKPELRSSMSELAIKRVQSLGGWDSYGNDYKKVVNMLF